MNVIYPAPHVVRYPGIDRFMCDQCKQWICTDHEISRLEKTLAKTKDKKRYAKLYAEIKQEKKNMNICVKLDKQT